MPDTKTPLHARHWDTVAEGVTEFFDSREEKGTLSQERLEEPYWMGTLCERSFICSALEFHSWASRHETSFFHSS